METLTGGRSGAHEGFEGAPQREEGGRQINTTTFYYPSQCVLRFRGMPSPGLRKRSVSGTTGKNIFTVAAGAGTHST